MLFLITLSKIINSESKKIPFGKTERDKLSKDKFFLKNNTFLPWITWRCSRITTSSRSFLRQQHHHGSSGKSGIFTCFLQRLFSCDNRLLCISFFHHFFHVHLYFIVIPYRLILLIFHHYFLGENTLLMFNLQQVNTIFQSSRRNRIQRSVFKYDV